MKIHPPKSPPGWIRIKCKDEWSLSAFQLGIDVSIVALLMWSTSNNFNWTEITMDCAMATSLFALKYIMLFLSKRALTISRINRRHKRTRETIEKKGTSYRVKKPIKESALV